MFIYIDYIVEIVCVGVLTMLMSYKHIKEIREVI